MRNAIFDMDCCLNRKRPIPIAEIGVNEQGACHRHEGEVAALCYPILIWGVWDCFFVGNACISAIGLKTSSGKLWGVVSANEGNSFATKILSYSTKFMKEIGRLIAGSHEIKGNMT